MEELIYKDLSYQLVGFAFQIDNEIGFGQKEVVYSNAFEKLLIKNRISYKREYYSPIRIDNELVARRYFDFLIDDRIIIEIKTGDYQFKNVCSQLFAYLKQSNIKLGLVIRFSKNGALIKRIPNLR